MELRVCRLDFGINVSNHQQTTGQVIFKASKTLVAVGYILVLVVWRHQLTRTVNMATLTLNTTARAPFNQPTNQPRMADSLVTRA